MGSNQHTDVWSCPRFKGCMLVGIRYDFRGHIWREPHGAKTMGVGRRTDLRLVGQRRAVWRAAAATLEREGQAPPLLEQARLIRRTKEESRCRPGGIQREDRRLETRHQEAGRRAIAGA